MNIQELLKKPDIKNYLDKFFNRVNLRKLSKTFPDILVEYDQLWHWNDFGLKMLSGNTYPKLNDYLNIMTNQTLKAFINYYAKGEVINQVWYANIKSKHSLAAYLVNILSMALNRIVKNNDLFNSALVVLAVILTLNDQSQKFNLLFNTTKDLDSDFEEIIFRIQQSMNALVPLQKMYEKWYKNTLPVLQNYFEQLNVNHDLIYLNVALNVGKIVDNADLLCKDYLFDFVYTDQIQLPSEWWNQLLISYCLWNFKNGNHGLSNLSILNVKYGLAYVLNIDELNQWLKKYFSINFHDVVKKVTNMINANKN